MTTAVGIEVFRDFAEIAKTELVVIDEDDHRARLPARAALEPGVLSTGPGLLTLPRALLSCAQSSPALSTRSARATTKPSSRASGHPCARSPSTDATSSCRSTPTRCARRIAARRSRRGRTASSTAGTPSRGVERQLALTEPARRHALHGLAALARLRGDRQGPEPRDPRGRHRAADGVPVARRGEDDVRARTPTGSRSPSRRRTRAADAAPWGTGPHPYLVAGAGHVDDWTLELPAAEVLAVTPDRLIPTGLRAVDADDRERFDFRDRAADRRGRDRPRVHRPDPRRRRARDGAGDGCRRLRCRDGRGMPRARGCRSTRPTRPRASRATASGSPWSR